MLEFVVTVNHEIGGVEMDLKLEFDQLCDV